MAKITFPVEATHILMFARSIGDDNPVYHDAEKARDSDVGGIIAPPTFTAAAAQFNPDGSRPRPGEKWFGSGKGPTGIEGKAPSAGGLNTEQHFEYFRPLRPGDVLTAETRPGTTWERESKRAGGFPIASRTFVISTESLSFPSEASASKPNVPWSVGHDHHREAIPYCCRGRYARRPEVPVTEDPLAGE